MISKLLNSIPPFVVLDFIVRCRKDEKLKSLFSEEFNAIEIYEEFGGVYTVINDGRFRFVKSDIDFKYNWSLKKTVVKELKIVFGIPVSKLNDFVFKILIAKLNEAYASYLSFPMKIYDKDGDYFSYLESFHYKSTKLNVGNQTLKRDQKEYISRYYFMFKMFEHFVYLNKMISAFQHGMYFEEFYINCIELDLLDIAEKLSNTGVVKLTDDSYSIKIEDRVHRWGQVRILKHKELPEGVTESTIYCGLDFASAMYNIKLKLDTGVRHV